MATAEELYSKVERVNELLQSQEPDNISVDDYGGYTGYKPQSIIDAMNRVFGLGAWGFRPISNEIMKDDKGGGLAVAKVQVFIIGVAWEPEAWGQNRVTKGDQGDARKGADTDAWKKGLSFFSIGNRAYHGLLPDKKEQAEQRRQEAAAQRQNAQNGNGRQPANPEPRPAQTAPQPQQASKPASAKPAEQAPLPVASQPVSVQHASTERPYLGAFNAGRAKGLWSDFAGFCTFATAELGDDVNRDNVRALTAEQLAKLDIAISEEEPVQQIKQAS